MMSIFPIKMSTEEKSGLKKITALQKGPHCKRIFKFAPWEKIQATPVTAYVAVDYRSRE